jgi:tetratricopeptide (TPR) repeat protein
MYRTTLFFLLFALAALSLSASNPKYEHAKRIFDRLVEARGDRSLKTPELVWTVEASNGAFYQPGTNQITFEEKAYNVCAGFGANTDNALAYILAHELVHYYKQHGWEAAFAKKFRDEEMTDAVKEQLRDMKRQETESDLLGGFLAYTAGYNTVGIAPEFLPALYKEYGWPLANPKYPTLEERILLAKTTEKELTNLIRMFETANMLVAIERYEDASQYYDYILSFYKSRELVNNVGVVNCMAALKLFDKDAVKYLYPLELDAESRVRLGSKGVDTPEGRKQLRDSLLNAAIGHFQESMSLDRDYHTARLNLASAHALLALSNAGMGEEEEFNYDFAFIYAKQVVRRAEKAEEAKLKADAVNLLGIIAARTGEGDAKALFESARALSPLAAYNLNILEGIKPEAAFSRKPKELMAEQIDDFDMDIFIRRPLPDTMIVVPGADKRQWGFKTKDLESSRILLDYVGRDHYSFFQFTAPGYEGKTQLGLKTGATRQEILAKYLQPDREVQLPNGHLLVYGADQIIFWLDQDQKLARWCVYRTKPDPE